MTDYTILSNTAVGVGGLPSGATVTALRDNPIAIAEGAVGAPLLHKVPLVISQTVISSTVATIEFFFDSTLYDEIIFSLGNVKNVDFGTVRVRLSGDGTSFSSGASDYRTLKHVDGTFSNTLSDFITLSTSVGSSGGEDGTSGYVRLFQPDLARRTMCEFKVSWTDTNAVYKWASGVFIRNSSIATNGVQFLSNGADFTSGTITMFGVLK